MTFASLLTAMVAVGIGWGIYISRSIGVDSKEKAQVTILLLIFGISVGMLFSGLNTGTWGSPIMIAKDTANSSETLPPLS